MAINPYTYCGDDWEEHTANACFTASSGMDAVYFFKPGIVAADYTTTVGDVTTVDVADIQALIDSGDAKLVLGLRIGIDAPGAVTGDSFVACTTETVITYTRTMTYKDRKVDAAGVKFYNSINSASGFVIGGMLVHECASGRITIIIEIIPWQVGRICPVGDEPKLLEATVTVTREGETANAPNPSA